MKLSKVFEKCIAVAICIAMMLFLIACSGKDESKPEPTQKPASDTATPTLSPMEEPSPEPSKNADTPTPEPIDTPAPTEVPATSTPTPTEMPATNTPTPTTAQEMKSTIDWQREITFPTAEEIAEYDQTSTNRSPYIAAWLKTDGRGRYTQYAIDFKADSLPDYTYCCLANFYLDYPELKEQYAKVYTEAISGYAGFQHRGPDQTAVGILSFWDLYCEDADGNKTQITPTRVYPEPDDDMTFGNEGEGVHCLKDYDWKQGKWYRMLLQCGVSETTGNTTIEQWVMDLESGQWTYLCKYDIGTKNVAFIGGNAIFLENFGPATSGDVRTMEVKNARILPEGSDQWVSVRSGYFSENFDYPGSYKYGTCDDTFWMITTGLSGKAGDPDSGRTLTVSGGEDSRPY